MTSFASCRLRKTGSPQVQTVADEVETLLAPLRVKLAGSLMASDNAPADPAAGKAALKAVAEARSWLDTDARVEAINTNPWKVPVSVAGTLGAALDRLESRLTARQGGPR